LLVRQKFTIPLKSHNGVDCILVGMRSLEVHVIETASDVESALTGGVLFPENLIDTSCSDCLEGIAYSGLDDFSPFCVVIDENNRDWAICIDCSSSVIDGAWRQATKLPEQYSAPNTYQGEEDLDFF